MSKAPNLAAALADASGSTRRKPVPPPVPVPQAESLQTATHYQQPGRAGTKPITVHFPEDVRSQLKLIALQERKTLHNLLAEAFNDVFAKYGKPEIAPTERQ
jgi:hypothetical protein